MLFGAAALACAQPQQQPFQTHQLAADVYWIEGGGGNSGVIVGSNGVVVIDAKTTPAGGKELLDSIAKITPKPVVAVIETHSDGDHVNGIAAFPSDVKVIAHENNKQEQEAAVKAGGRGAPPADRLPAQTVSGDHETLKIAGLTIEAYHWAPAHTTGDLVLYLPAQKIVFTGDIVATQFPNALIHLEKHGTSAGWIETMKGMAGLDCDHYVPGHGNVQSKADIEKRVAEASAKRDRIREMAAQGKSLDEIKAAVDTPAPAGRGGGPNFASFTEVVYRETAAK